MSKAYLGIDNGSTGWICLMREGLICEMRKAFVKKEIDSASTQRKISRLDLGAFINWITEMQIKHGEIMAVIEKHFMGLVNVRSMTAAARFYEATLIAMELTQTSYHVITALKWQSKLLGKPKAGQNKKKLALGCAQQMFPNQENMNLQSADAAMISTWASIEQL